MPFYHGVEVIEIDSGPRPIRTNRSAVIGVIGTAPDADNDKFPLDVPILIAGNRSEAAGLGTTGTLPAAINDIFDQTGAMVVVVRVAISEGEIALPNGIDDETGQYLGVQSFLAAENETGVAPRILVAPEFSQTPVNGLPLVTIAEQLKAIVVIDGLNVTDRAAELTRGVYGSARAYYVEPWVKVFDRENNEEIIRPASARIAGVIAKSDAERGFWWSPSNREILGVLGTSRQIDFSFGVPTSRANWLNEREIATIIKKDGFRLWGNRSCSADPKWAFLSVRRTADVINESLLQAHLWAVDRGTTRTYVEDVLESVNGFLRSLKTRGAIINGQTWVDPERNTPLQIADGQVQFDFDFTPVYPAERLTFRSQLVNDYLVEIIP